MPRALPPLIATLLLCLILIGAVPASAQVDGPHAQLGVGYGAAWFEKWLGIEDGGAWVVRASYHPRASWGLEGHWDHVSSGTREFAGSGSSTFDFYAIGARFDALPFRTLSPYAAISLGYARVGLPEESFGGVGLGLAIGANWRVWGQTALFTEFRDDLAKLQGYWTHQVIFSVGLRFSFGSSVDRDGDGVSDGLDLCPDTPRGAVVDERGCPSDPDGDGIPEGLDHCPGTPAGTAVDSHGCPQQRAAPPSEG